MNFKNLTATVRRGISMTGFKLKNASPEILIGAGIIGLVGAGVLACKATLKVEGIVDEAKKDVEMVRGARDGELPLKEGEVYDEKMAKKDLTTIYIRTGARFVKVYGPAVILATLSIVSILSGHNILKKRHLATVAAFTGLQETFKDYRKRVGEKFGDEAEKLLYHDGEKMLISEQVINEETGEVETVTKDVIVGNKKVNLRDPYSFIFDVANAPRTWSKAPGYNYTFLIQQQNWANERLQSKGYVTLNQVLESLGMEPTDDGMTLGWLLKNPNGTGDGFIDFGIIHGDNWRDPGCFAGGSPDYILNFNCDGIITGGMPKKKPMRPRKGAVVC